MRDSRESHQNLYMSSGDHDSLMAVHPAAAHPHSLAWLMRIIKPTSVTPHRHCQDSVIYCTESRSTGTHSPASSAVSHQWCVVSLSVTVHSEKRKKGNRVTDRAPFCVIQDGFNCVWAVSSSASLRERDARLLLCCHRDDLPGRRLTYIWDTNQLPCLRSWRHKLKALFRKRRIKQRENVSLFVCVRRRGRMRRHSRKQRTLR